MSSVQPTEFVVPKLTDLTPTKYYCEENVWQLAKHVLETNKNTPGLKCYAVVLCNPERNVHLWYQDLSDLKKHDPEPSVDDHLMFWDYHVFFMTEYQDQVLVFDYNSILEFPVSFSQYASKSIKIDFRLKRYFKVIEAEKYISLFSSDRKHMLIEDDLANRIWLESPPPYEPILNEEGVSTFETLICMDKKIDEFGEKFTVEEFIAKFTRPSK